MEEGIERISTMDVVIDPSDRISQLPEDIKLRIVSFLPTSDVIRISVLSKTWHRVWTSVPIWDFSESLFGLQSAFGLSCENKGTHHSEIKDRRENFLNFVDNALLRQQCHQNKCTDRFQLCMNFNPQAISHVDHWIQLLAQFGVKVLDLDFGCRRSDDIYHLQQTISSANPSTAFRLHRSGTDLKLSLALDAVHWPSLQVLSLKNVCLDNQVIQNLIFSCPSIEKLTLLSCFGIRSIWLLGFTKLSNVKVIDPRTTIKEIKIDALSLKAFHFISWSLCHLDITSCKNLEVLKLKSHRLAEHICQDLISKFPALKVLVLRYTSFERITISSQQLEKLELSPLPAVEAIIDAPSLKSFKYVAGSNASLLSVHKSCLEEVTLQLEELSLCANCFLKLIREDLGNFNQIKFLTLIVASDTITYALEDLNDFSLPSLLDIKNLKLEIHELGGGEDQAIVRMNYKVLLDSLLWTCHPESLSLKLNWGDNNKFVKVLCDEISDQKEREHCCASSHIKCWRHDLKCMQVECFKGNGEHTVLTCAALLNLLPTLSQQQDIGFKFKW